MAVFFQGCCTLFTVACECQWSNLFIYLNGIRKTNIKPGKVSLSHYRWMCIYPAYINSKKTLAEGRRIPKDKASVLKQTLN
jgi:hypothetical protein